MRWTSFAVILMVGSLTLAANSDARAGGLGGRGGLGGQGRHGGGGGFGGGGILGGILGGIAKGVQQGSHEGGWGGHGGWGNQNNGNWFTLDGKHKNKGYDGWVPDYHDDDIYDGEGEDSHDHHDWHVDPNVIKIIPHVINSIPKPTPHKIYPPPYVPTYQPDQVVISPQPNTIPAPPKANKIDVAAKVKENTDFSLTAQGMTAAVLAEWKRQAREQNEAVLGEIGNLIGQNAGALAGLDDVTRKVNSGTLTGADLQALASTMKPNLAPGTTRSANELLNRLAVLSRLTAIFGTAVPGAGGPIPVGNRVPIVLVPGLPRGQVILLGNGAVLVGAGHLCRHVAVGRGNVAQCVGMTVGVGAPLPDSDGKLVAGGTLLINGEEGAVNYNLNGHPYTMQAKYRQPLAAGSRWVIAFDRGGSFGEARYTLSEGTYKFTLTDEGWTLYKHTFDVSIDNGQNPFEFRYLVNNEHQTLPSGHINKHSSLYPMLVRFDNGRGQTKAKSIECGTYDVAVTQENTLDLFADDAVAEPSIGAPRPNTIPAASTTSATLTSTTTAATAVGDALGGNPFGGRGDWRPSLFVSDVPEVDYFGDPEVAGG